MLKRALEKEIICICKVKSKHSDKLIECHTESCNRWKYFHLSCLSYKWMPNNAKKTWQCSFCKVRITGKSVPETKLENNTDSGDTDSGIYLGWESVDFDDRIDLFQSDVCNPDVVITKLTTGQAEKTASVAQLTDEHFELVRSPDGWLDCKIIHQVHVYLSEIYPSIQGFQRPTFGPCKNFVTGEVIQILHTGNYHWVCVSSKGVCEA